MLSFRDMTLEDHCIVDRAVEESGFLHSDFSFTDLYIWRHAWPVGFCVEDDTVFLYCTSPERGIPSFLPPVGGKLSKKEALLKIKEYCDANGYPMRLYSVPESWAKELPELFGDSVEVTYDRDFSDYVYTQQALATLSGKKLHGKKNHVNRFRASYESTYRELTAEDLPDCLRMFDRWLDQKEDDLDYGIERAMVEEAISLLPVLPMRAGGIYIDGELVAFTVAEIRGDTAVVHVEKALPTINGLFSAINQFFVANTLQDMTYINREEDMGIEGLRKAKESYHPEFMVNKYIARWKA
ncbi:MAG: DUF2156 domain-containing protein [Clostridia bacterium]|nr:DUF2156 domain-containing protein [Clostridia bacterium]